MSKAAKLSTLKSPSEPSPSRSFRFVRALHSYNISAPENTVNYDYNSAYHQNKIII